MNKESSFCDRGVNTCWIGLLAGAICYQGGAPLVTRGKFTPGRESADSLRVAGG